jgi:hypothetical protein
MFTAWSPTRSRSLDTLMAPTRKRRSRAIGCCSARSCTGGVLDLDLEQVELAVAGDHRVGGGRVARHERVDRELDERLGALAHGEQPALEVGELLVEMAVPAGRAAGGRGGGAAERERHGCVTRTVR